jgi:hypothetical protein
MRATVMARARALAYHALALAAAAAVAMLLHGCDAARTTAGPTAQEAAPWRQPRPAPLSPQAALWELSALVVDPQRAAAGTQVTYGRAVAWLGPQQGWSAWLPYPPPRGATLRVEAGGTGCYPMRATFVGPPPPQLSVGLLPRVALADGVYAEAFDLLVELVRPFGGATIRRWPPAQLRVALPPDTFTVRYAQACEQAIAAWNLALGEPRLQAVPTGADAQVRTTVAPEAQLAFTQLEREDEWGHPLAMRVHVSPRYVVGAERYVRRAYLHELGHVLGLWGHSRDRAHIMNGVAVTSDSIHADERRVARWLWALPNDCDLSFYVRPAGPAPLTRSAESMAAGTAASHP